MLPGQVPSMLANKPDCSIVWKVGIASAGQASRAVGGVAAATTAPASPSADDDDDDDDEEPELMAEKNLDEVLEVRA